MEFPSGLAQCLPHGTSVGAGANWPVVACAVSGLPLINWN